MLAEMLDQNTPISLIARISFFYSFIFFFFFLMVLGQEKGKNIMNEILHLT
jgi:hypothetical protein